MDSLCRILKNGSEDTAGSGFLIGPKRMITCAHVLDTAFEKQGGEVKIGSLVDQIKCGDQILEGRVRHYEPINESVANDPQDIAVIELTEKKNEPAFKVRPLLLDGFSINHNLNGERCLVGYNITRKKWTVTECRKTVDKGHYELSVLTGIIPFGSSGGPVVASLAGRDCIVGMVHARTEKGKAALIIPRSHFEEHIKYEESYDVEHRNQLLIRLVDRVAVSYTHLTLPTMDSG